MDVSGDSSDEERDFGDKEKPPLKKLKLHHQPPTAEEINELNATHNLYNNNLFRIQTEELIKEVKVKAKYRTALAAWYATFQTLLNKFPEHDITLSDIKRKQKVKSKTDKFINAIVSDSIKCDQDFVVKFAQPESCETFGLATMEALPGPKLCTNINLKMPRSCFNVKDYCNNRYFVKRYYYLAYIAYYLKKKQVDGEVIWTHHNNNDLLPILLVKVSEKIEVRIFATPTENYFKYMRFGADVNNVKTNVFNIEVNSETPTVFYNTSLAHDVTLTTNQNFIKSRLAEFPNVQEAVKLIYVWLVQRELNKGLGSFTDDLVLYFIVYLLKKTRINKHMSSYQVIRNFWNFFAETDLVENPASLSDDVKDDVMKKFQASFDVVFLDNTGYYNVAAFLNINVYKKIKKECGIAFKLLDDDGVNSFHNLFISKLPLELQYDLILTLKSDSDFTNISDKMTEENRTKFLGHSKSFIVKYIADVLHQGLNKRATLIVPLLTDSIQNKISFGISLDSINAFNILELGPALNDPKEKDFREFWGELSTDRRFKDGSACVTVYFETKTIKQRREIIKTITDWVVTKKLNLEYKLYYNDFEEFLVNKKITASYPMGTNEECSLKAIAASDDLGKKLRKLEMPLSITGIQGISDTFNMTEVFPPISSSYRCGGKITSTIENNIVLNDKHVGVVPRYVKPIESVLRLEHSAKWAKDLQTLRSTKTAFFLEISKLLSTKHKLISSVKPDFFDVLYEGYVFRYHLYLSREVGLLKKESTNNGVIVYKDTPQSKEMETKLNILPKVIGALKGLQAQHPSYGPATALIKRWIRSQLLDDWLLPDNVISLLTASLYLNQSAFDVPSTPQIGFLRFLKYFSELQWQIQPVIVNFNDEIKKETITEIDSKLLQNRDAFPNLFIAMPYDNCESLFTKAAPSKEVLNRVRQLAKETLNHFMKIVSEDSSVTFKHLFMPSMDGYDLIIQLRPLLNPVRHEQVNSDELGGQIVLTAFNAAESTKIPLTDFNPVQCYLKELRENYGEFANFFHDSYGGNSIGVLWIPNALQSKDFKVSSVNGRKLTNEKLELNLDSIIEDFYILGRGVVKTIDKHK